MTDISIESPFNRCSRIKLNGDQCKRPPIRGGTVCFSHGGAAPAVRAKAETRLLLSGDKLMAALLKIALDENQPVLARLTAIRDGLDRAGLGARKGLDLEVNTKVSVYDQIVLASVVPVGSYDPDDWDDMRNYDADGKFVPGLWAQLKPNVIDAVIVEDEDAQEAHERAQDEAMLARQAQRTENLRRKNGRRGAEARGEIEPPRATAQPADDTAAVRQAREVEDFNAKREAFILNREAPPKKRHRPRTQRGT